MRTSTFTLRDIERALGWGTFVHNPFWKLPPSFPGSYSLLHLLHAHWCRHMNVSALILFLSVMRLIGSTQVILQLDGRCIEPKVRSSTHSNPIHRNPNPKGGELHANMHVTVWFENRYDGCLGSQQDCSWLLEELYLKDLHGLSKRRLL